jgi:hypothetical protein
VEPSGAAWRGVASVAYDGSESRGDTSTGGGGRGWRQAGQAGAGVLSGDSARQW